MARVGTSSPLTLLKGRLYRQLIRHRLRLLSGLENSAALFDCPERTILYPISKHAPSLRRANNACGSSGSLLRLAGPWSLALFLLFFFFFFLSGNGGSIFANRQTKYECLACHSISASLESQIKYSVPKEQLLQGSLVLGFAYMEKIMKISSINVLDHIHTVSMGNISIWSYINPASYISYLNL